MSAASPPRPPRPPARVVAVALLALGLTSTPTPGAGAQEPVASPGGAGVDEAATPLSGVVYRVRLRDGRVLQFDHLADVPPELREHVEEVDYSEKPDWHDDVSRPRRPRPASSPASESAPAVALEDLGVAGLLTELFGTWGDLQMEQMGLPPLTTAERSELGERMVLPMLATLIFSLVTFVAYVAVVVHAIASGRWLWTLGTCCCCNFLAVAYAYLHVYPDRPTRKWMVVAALLASTIGGAVAGYPIWSWMNDAVESRCEYAGGSVDSWACR